MVKKEDLFNEDPQHFGEKYHEYLLKQYEIYVNMADRTSERRGKSNTFFVTINSAFIAIMGLFTKLTDISITVCIIWMILTSVFCIVLCTIWKSILESYKSLNEARFHVIHMIEETLPISLFKSEWDYIENEQVNKYSMLSHKEKDIPNVFIIIYIVFILLGSAYLFYLNTNTVRS